ncbi:MAG: sugar phosphate isomerase/epimerase, partial [Lentisphaeria bacterium]|nr:sugar phosphate isomerase/epimerase [Lentisphaeria bacterium]
QELKRGADFAAACGLRAIITHCGFLPENMTDPEFMPVAVAIREVAQYCKSLGIEFWFETGQETPLTLLRTMEDLNLPNLGVNLDTANLILYGRGNPVDALRLLGTRVKNLHMKDGLLPVNGHVLGKEVPLGEGIANIDKVVEMLHELNFTGELIIEREISGPQQLEDILKARTYLEGLIAKYSK